MCLVLPHNEIRVLFWLNLGGFFSSLILSVSFFNSGTYISNLIPRSEGVYGDGTLSDKNLLKIPLQDDLHNLSVSAIIAQFSQNFSFLTNNRISLTLGQS